MTKTTPEWIILYFIYYITRSANLYALHAGPLKIKHPSTLVGVIIHKYEKKLLSIKPEMNQSTYEYEMILTEATDKPRPLLLSTGVTKSSRFLLW